jgi:hypothetical protein
MQFTVAIVNLTFAEQKTDLKIGNAYLKIPEQNGSLAGKT